MLNLILLILIIILAWFEIIPIRLWEAKAKTKVYGSSTRLKIYLIKLFEPLLEWLDSL